MERQKDVLATVRKQGMTQHTNVSEIEMRQENESADSLFRDLQALKAEIARKKQEASKRIDEEYSDRLRKAQERYALCMKLMR